MKYGISILALGICLTLGACGQKTDAPQELEAITQDLCIENANSYNDNGKLVLTDIAVDQGVIKNYIADSEGDLCHEAGVRYTQIVDLKGAYLYPGFVDSHAHLLGIGLREMTLNLEDLPSIKTLVQTLADEVAKTPKGETIYGRGWIETHWPEGRFPTRQDLDAVSPDNPVILGRADGHAMVINSAALKAAGITTDTVPPFGGDILHDEDGIPTGMLIDNAMPLATGLLADLTLERKRAAYIKGSEVYAALGWTGIQSMSVDAADVELIEQLSDEGLLKIRVYNSVDMRGAEALLEGIANDGPRSNENGRVVTRAVKLYADGALGSRGAALLAPYSDDPKNMGLMVVTHETIMPILVDALTNGIQINTHAIGDRANRLILDWYEEAFKAVPKAERKVKQPRWRIEHAQIIDMSDIERFAKLGVIASMQPSHAIGDLHFAVDRLGVERLKGGYAWNTLVKSGVKIAGGSDAPVERGDPRIEYYGAVARKDMNGFSGEGWYPEEKVNRSEALKMFTEWPAYAAFEEDSAGKIAPNMRADFTIFNRDIMTIPEPEILTVDTVMTIVDGEIVYQSKD